MSLLEEIVGRLVLTPKVDRAARPSVAGQVVKPSRLGATVHRVVLGASSVRSEIIRPLREPGVSVGRKAPDPETPDVAGSREVPPTFDESSFQRRTEVDPTPRIDSIAVRTRNVVAPRGTGSASEPHIREGDDLKRYAIGAVGGAGRSGVSPVEMSQYRPSGAGTRGRLVAAIEDFVSEEMTRHSAGLIRQGISSR